jgi:triacylglycerol lipase
MPRAAQTRYPLVLVHGLLGFVRLAGRPYWYGIDSALRRQGAQVFCAKLSPLNGNEVRGEQLLERLGEILAASGARKVNLIGHSQGALSVRYAAALKPQWVASVTSVGGPNQGSEVADYLVRLLPHHGRREKFAARAAHGAARLLELFESREYSRQLPLDGMALQRALSSEGMRSFNQRFPQGLPTLWGGEGDHQVDGVRYYSWAGTLQPGITDRGRNRLDPSQMLCRALSRTFVREAGQNDGMVGRFSTHLGRVIRSDYPMDHLDLINQFSGRVGSRVDPLRLYLDHAARLREAGC